MIKKFAQTLFAIVALSSVFWLPVQLSAQTPTQAQLDSLERRVSDLESRTRGEQAAGLAVFLCGAFCALWAQQTRRNAWAWFFLGLLFNVITLLVLLHKNSNDRQREAGKPPTI